MMVQASVMGHSMGGHGALVLALRKPGLYKSVSAFAPICNPTRVPWGKKAFSGYLGADEAAWKAYDATELVAAMDPPAEGSAALPVLVDTGTDDEFLKEQLHPWALEEAAAGKLHLKSNMRVGYDHSYYFIASFMEDHVEFAAKHLKKGSA